ncbi:hypothetical protein ACUR5C_08420 [Aliikangiella sp. IMCC44653]
MKDVSSKFLISGLIITGLVSMLSAIGGFAVLNLATFDHFTKLNMRTNVESNLLIIKPDSSSQLSVNNQRADQRLQSSDLEELIQQLNQFNAKAVIIISQSSQLETVAGIKANNWFFASPYNSLIDKNLTDFKIPSIKTIPIYANNGVYRQYSVEGHSQNLLNFIGLELNNAIDIQEQAANKTFFNTFIAPSSFPYLTLSQIKNGNLVEELVRDKLILIEVDSHIYYNQFSIASTDNASFTELQAIILESAEQKLDFVLLHWSITTLIIILFFIINFILLQILSARGILLNLIFTLVSIYFIAFACLFYLQLILPMIELIAIQAISLVYFLSSKRQRDESFIHSVTANINSRLSKKLNPTEFNDTDKPWSKLHNLLNHHLVLKRSIFLEKTLGSSHVQEIDAFNCSIEAIKERRRDFKREPYLSATAKKIPMRLTKKPYFKDLESNELEYIVALEFANQLLGFWALTINSTEHPNLEQFESQVSNFAAEFSELLYHRSKFIAKQQANKSLLKRFVGVEVAQQEFIKLDASITAFEKRYDILQEIFNGMSSAAVLFDLFGQLVVFNRAAEKLASDYHTSLFSLSAHDLLMRVTNKNVNEVKRTLRQVTTQNEEVEFQISSSKGVSNYVLKVKAISAKDAEYQVGVPFLVIGILFEFVNVATVQDVIERKKDLFTKHFYQMSNNLSSISLLARRIKKVEGDKLAQTINLIDESVIETHQLQKKVEDSLYNIQTPNKTGQALDVIPLINKAIQAVNKQINEKTFKIDLDAPKILSLVVTSPEIIYALFENIIKLLVNDSQQEEPIIRIKVLDKLIESVQQRKICLAFKNKGFGMPVKELEELKSKTVSEVSETDNINNILFYSNQLKKLNVLLELNSAYGEGFEINIHIPIFETS